MTEGPSGMNPERRFRRTGDVVRREVVGEVFLVPIRGQLADLQELFVLNEVGDWIWARLTAACSIDELMEGIVAGFEVTPDQARADAERFLQELAQAGLVEEIDLTPAGMVAE